MEEHDYNAERIVKLRKLMKEQDECVNIQSGLCDEIRMKRHNLGLDDIVAELETSSPKLYKYIRKLEHIEYGIWCGKCQTIKNVGKIRDNVIEPVVEPVVEANPVTQSHDILLNKYEKLTEDFYKLSSLFNEKMEKMGKEILLLKDEIDSKKPVEVKKEPILLPQKNNDNYSFDKILNFTKDNSVTAEDLLF